MLNIQQIIDTIYGMSDCNSQVSKVRSWNQMCHLQDADFDVHAEWFVMLGIYSCFKINVVEIVGFVHCLGRGRVCVMQCSIRFQRFQIKNSVFTSGCNLRKHRIAIHSRLKTILYSTPSGISWFISVWCIVIRGYSQSQKVWIFRNAWDSCSRHFLHTFTRVWKQYTDIPTPNKTFSIKVAAGFN